MINKNSYYIPKINEFHIGFHYTYQYLDSTGTKARWKDEIVCITDHLKIMEEDIKNNRVRVNYLNINDFINLNWNISERTIDFIKGDFRSNVKVFNFTYITKFNILTISDNKNQLFEGIILNYSELNKLMIQLNIKKEITKFSFGNSSN